MDRRVRGREKLSALLAHRVNIACERADATEHGGLRGLASGGASVDRIEGNITRSVNATAAARDAVSGAAM